MEFASGHQLASRPWDGAFWGGERRVDRCSSPGSIRPKTSRTRSDPGSPAQASLPNIDTPEDIVIGLRPFLGRPLLASRFASPDPKTARSRVALEKINSSGASSRLAPDRSRESSPMPAGGDRTFGHLPLPPAVAGSWEAGTFLGALSRSTRLNFLHRSYKNRTRQIPGLTPAFEQSSLGNQSVQVNSNLLVPHALFTEHERDECNQP
jgi:hypothetical protein